MITKLISGGQVGADVAALVAARRMGITTGGWAPKGYRVRGGVNEDLRDVYGLQEHESDRYPPRTFANVRDSDGTMRFAFDLTTPGERCTMNAIKRFKKPHLDVEFVWMAGLPGYWQATVPIIEARDWLRENKIRVLNIAGNANNAIEPLVSHYIRRLLA